MDQARNGTVIGGHRNAAVLVAPCERSRRTVSSRPDQAAPTVAGQKQSKGAAEKEPTRTLR